MVWLTSRFVPSLAGAVLFLLLAAILLLAPAAFYECLKIDGTIANTAPFWDLGAILQAGVCWRHGVNVYAASACMGGGVYNYSPSLLWAAYLPLGPQDRIAGGVLLGVLFLGAVSLLPPPASRAEMVWRSVAVCSSTVVWAVEEANFDIVVFMLVVLGLAVLVRYSRLAAGGYLLFLLAASAKFYPAVLLALVVRERLAVILGVATLVCLGLMFYVLHFAHGAAAAIRIVPGGPPFSYVFGASNLPTGLVLLRYGQDFMGAHHAQAGRIIAPWTGALCLAGAGFSALSARHYGQALAALAPARSLPLLAGGLLIAFCFCLAQNLDYRGIFLLLTLPGLWAMAMQATGPLRRRILVLHGGVVFLMWEPFCRHIFGVATSALMGAQGAIGPRLTFWLFREACWWWVVVQFGALVLCFLGACLRMQVKMLRGDA